MGPDPTKHTFDPQYVIGLGTFWTDPMRFFWSEGEKIEKFVIFRQNFPKPNQRCRQAQQKIDLTQPRLKFLNLTHH